VEAAPDARIRRLATARPSEPAASVALRLDGITIRETAIVRSTPTGDLFGILAAPESPRPTPVAAVFLNAGAVRRIGPNRIWVEASRRWARRGVPTLRIDLDGIGDSDGDAGRYRDVGQFYARDELADQIRILTDELLARTGAERVILAGLCAGGYWAFRGADRDPRVVAAYLLNPGALEWQTDLVRRRDARRLRRLADPIWWRRLVRGQVRLARIRSVAAAAVSEGIHGRVGAAAPSSPGDADRAEAAPAAIVGRLDARGTTVVMAFSNDEALHDELERDGFLAGVAALPNVRLETLPGRDHTLRPMVAQRAVHDLLDRALLADLGRLGVRSDTGAA
jgi:dienelactone hydrolase